MSIIDLLEERVKTLDPKLAVGLYPDNEIAKLLRERLGDKRVMHIFNDSKQDVDVVVVCSDEGKIEHLKQLREFDWQGKYPKIIMAGTGHMLGNQREANALLAKQVNKSEATGYDLAQTHLYECMRELKHKRLSGNIIELGSYKGGTITFLYNIAKACNISQTLTFTAFDAWDGTFHRHDFLDLFDMTEWVGNNITEVRALVPESINLIQGEIKDTVPGWLSQQGEQVVLAFIDTDNYSPVASTLPFIWEKLMIGGFVIFDHYFTRENFFNTIGEHIAAHDFFAERTDFFNLSGTGVFLKIK